MERKVCFAQHVIEQWVIIEQGIELLIDDHADGFRALRRRPLPKGDLAEKSHQINVEAGEGCFGNKFKMVPTRYGLDEAGNFHVVPMCIGVDRGPKENDGMIL